MATLGKEYRRRYYADHKERMKEQIRQHYLRNKPAARARYRKYAKTTKGRYAIYRNGAKRRGITFSITLDDFSRIVASPCYYCGEGGYGVDRIDSAVGYFPENIVPCCSECNWMKQSSSREDFIRRCIKIAKRHCESFPEQKSA